MRSSNGAYVRRVRPQDWREVKQLRLQALGDPAAALAFYGSVAEAKRRPDSFWKARAKDSSQGDATAEFFTADAYGVWVGSLSVLRKVRAVPGQAVLRWRADVVGVYVAPSHRGTGTLGQLVDAAIAWAGAQGDTAIWLNVHAENSRAITAYTRLGFRPTGHTFVSGIGPELEMRRSISASR